MQLTSFLENSRLTIALSGEIDHHRARSYIDTIAAKIDAYTPTECILDFSEVSFVDSSGIAVVINSMRRMAQIEGELYLTGLGDEFFDYPAQQLLDGAKSAQDGSYIASELFWNTERYGESRITFFVNRTGFYTYFG